MKSVCAPAGDIAMLRLEKSAFRGPDFGSVRTALCAALEEGHEAVLLSVAGTAKLRASEIAAIVDMAAAAQPAAHFAVCDASPEIRSAFRENGIDQVVPVFASAQRALDSAEFRARRLTQTPAIVLCAEKRAEMAPISQMASTAMLDLMGRPLVEHTLRHLKSMGVRNVTLNPGHAGPQIPAHFARGQGTRQSIFYINEGQSRDGRWVAQPSGSAATLARWASDHNGFSSDTIVYAGDILSNIDLIAMMEHHRKSGAMVTVAARPGPSLMASRFGTLGVDGSSAVTSTTVRAGAKGEALANAGIYIFSPDVREHLSLRFGADVAEDLIPELVAKGHHVEAFTETFSWREVSCGRDLMDVWRDALEGRLPWVTPDAQEIRPGLWAQANAEISRVSDIEGPAFVSAGAVVAKGASLRGPVVLGQGARALKRSYLRDSILLAGSTAGSGALVDGMIANGRWAVAHTFADGSQQSWDPLPDVVPNTPASVDAGLEADPLDVFPSFGSAAGSSAPMLKQTG